jgi:hypothetical protein
MRSVTRRSVVKLAYAAPLVAATTRLPLGGQVAAYYGGCSCYPPADHYDFSSNPGHCDPFSPEPCGSCVSCSPAAGANCPEGTRAGGGQLPFCLDAYEFPDCKPVFRPVCEVLISRPI